MISIREIWDEQATLSEKYIKTPIDSIEAFKVFIATNQFTGKRLFIINLDKQTPDNLLKKAKFRGLAIEILEFDDHKELTIILFDNALVDIFSAFIEDIILELTQCLTNDDILNSVSKVTSRWKRLFDKANTAAMTSEQQKGFFGELFLLKNLLNEGYPAQLLMEAWTGPLGGDKDFIFGDAGIEVKLTSSKHPALKITSELQLETGSLDKLYLFLFVVEEVKKNGLSIIDLIAEIRISLNSNPDIFQIFNDRIRIVGYLEDDNEYYEQQYHLKEFMKYHIDGDFPRLTGSDLATGIYSVSYSIELSACEEQKINSSTITELLNGY
ncbi:PD-(D/E)XK motif protein [Pedobacter sp. AW31-3R]|uniref:PD-(D/E)XK motif protein n=1 Tax=Pedobacter sp. AW31-3R TaxID=3445781 RepID=UPI003FA1249F